MMTEGILINKQFKIYIYIYLVINLEINFYFLHQ